MRTNAEGVSRLASFGPTMANHTSAKADNVTATAATLRPRPRRSPIGGSGCSGDGVGFDLTSSWIELAMLS